MSVIGQFRDPDRPDSFVWLRGFPDMAARHASLTVFYDGPVWAANRKAANATMIDSDDVLVLRPTSPAHHLPARDPSTRNHRVPVGAVVVVIEHSYPADHEAALTRFREPAYPRSRADRVSHHRHVRDRTRAQHLRSASSATRQRARLVRRLGHSE